MQKIKNQCLEGPNGKPIVLDVFFEEDNKAKPVIVFCHGYKGFKDWGAWNLMAEAFAKAGFFFVKFNFSYNGGTLEQPIDFPDLEAFGMNNYTKELDDLETVLDWLVTTKEYADEIDITAISLIGHSRAGGIVTIKAEENKSVNKVISLAGVCDYATRSATVGDLEAWKKAGVKYVLNGRTKQEMPHYYQFYENFKKHEERLTIQRAVRALEIPYLIIHGDKDTSISIDEAFQLNSWSPQSELVIVKNANHVFGAVHPWEKEELPEHLKEVVAKSVLFLRKSL